MFSCSGNGAWDRTLVNLQNINGYSKDYWFYFHQIHFDIRNGSRPMLPINILQISVNTKLEENEVILMNHINYFPRLLIFIFNSKSIRGLVSWCTTPRKYHKVLTHCSLHSNLMFSGSVWAPEYDWKKLSVRITLSMFGTILGMLAKY